MQRPTERQAPEAFRHGSPASATGPVFDERPLAFEGAVFPSPLQRFAPYFVELLGTFILTTTFVYNYRHMGDPLWSATSNGLMVMALTYAFGHISGANLNPSISLALLMSGRQSTNVVGRLCAVQILGAGCAAAMLRGLTQATVDIGPINEHTWRAVVVVEVVYTGVLCFVYLNCAASTRNNPSHKQNGFIGLAMGFIFVAGGYAAREVSRTVLNSAIAAGLTVVNCRDGFSLSGIGYFVADIAGAFLAAGAYRLTRPAELEHRDETCAGAFAATMGSSRSLGWGSAPTGVYPTKKCQKDTDSARVAAEFFGTFVVIFTKALNRLGTANAVGPEAWSVAASLTSMVYALRDVSGAYFNPAVTFAAWLSGRTNIRLRTAMFYMVAQVFAGIAASSVFSAMNNGKPMPLTFGARASTAVAIYGEGCFTCLIAYVVLAMTATNAKDARPRSIRVGVSSSGLAQNDIAGFAYGACQIAGGFAVGHISGAMLNPAVVLSFNGLDIVKGHFRGDVMLYVVWEFFGAVVATGIFMITHVQLYNHTEGELP